MFIEGVLAGAGLAAVVAYFVNKSFRTKVQTDVQAVKVELDAVRTKVNTGVAVFEADFAVLKTKLAALLSKL